MTERSTRYREAPDRNLAMELVRVTEAAAMAAGRWVGRGDKNGGDGAAVDAMRQLIGTVSMRGVVVIGEGEKDEAPMLFNGEKVGNGWGPDCDVAVDPIDGTTLMSKGMPNALAVLAVAERGAMYDPSAVFYMEKLAVGPEAADVVDIRLPVAENIRRVAKAKRETVEDVTVVMLDRPRHDKLAAEVREAGSKVRFISDGDVAGAIAAARPETDVDILLGVGGTPEGIITAAAMMPSGVPPMPSKRSTPVPGRAAEIAPATSPSVMNRMRAPASRTSCTSCSWRGRSRIHTVTSSGCPCLAFATRRTFSATGAVMSMTSAASGPVAIFSM